MRSILLAACVLLAAPAALAQRPQPGPALELGSDHVGQAVMVTGAWADVDTSPRTRPSGTVLEAAEAEASARHLLAAYADRAALPPLEDLAHTATTAGPAGHAVHFQQTVGGVPVLGADVVVNVTADGEVPFARLNHRAGLSVATTEPAVTAEAARGAVLAHLGVRGAVLLDEARLVVAPTPAGGRLAWQVRVSPEAPYGDWEALVDARTGELFRVADRRLYSRGSGGWGYGSAPAAGATTAAPVSADGAPAAGGPAAQGGARTLSRADGTAMVFLPDPLTPSGAVYGDPGFEDADDADSPELTAARVEVPLQDITFDGAKYHLRGRWAVATDGDPIGPKTGTFPQDTPAWDFTRSHDAFEYANAYYHIDAFMRYVNDTLGVAVVPNQSGNRGKVQFDAHGCGGCGNNFFAVWGEIILGDGGVDGGEDAEVVVHELGHGVHRWLVGPLPNNNYATGDMFEGFADYVAASYTRSLRLLTPESPSYDWVFRWKGHNPIWAGRVTDYAERFPAGTGAHEVGQHWSTANMRVWEALGREATDRAVFEGIRLTGTDTTQPQAAQAVLQAAFNMGYPQSSLDVIFASYVAQGYAVTMPSAVPTGAGPERGSLALSAAPNPTSGVTSLTVRSDRSEVVDVAVFDVLGRRVAALFTGAVNAGEVRVVQADLTALPTGLYVARVSAGARAQTARLTVAR